MAFGTFCESMRVDDDGKSQMEKRDSGVEKKGYRAAVYFAKFERRSKDQMQ